MQGNHLQLIRTIVTMKCHYNLHVPRLNLLKWFSYLFSKTEKAFSNLKFSCKSKWKLIKKKGRKWWEIWQRDKNKGWSSSFFIDKKKGVFKKILWILHGNSFETMFYRKPWISSILFIQVVSVNFAKIPQVFQPKFCFRIGISWDKWELCPGRPCHSTHVGSDQHRPFWRESKLCHAHGASGRSKPCNCYHWCTQSSRVVQ